MRRKGDFRKGNKGLVIALKTSISNYFLPNKVTTTQMKNYKRQAQKQHIKNKVQNLKDQLKEYAIRLNLVETPEVHIASVMENRQLPTEVTN